MGMANTFGARLIRARVAEGLSQSDLAASSGIAPAQISRYEADKNQPRLHILRKLAAALDIAPDRQLAGDDEADTEPADTAPTTQCKAHPRRYACVPQQAGGLVQPQPQRRDRSPPSPDPGRRLRRRAARCAAGASRDAGPDAKANRLPTRVGGAGAPGKARASGLAVTSSPSTLKSNRHRCQVLPPVIQFSES
ncbi:helix-turn-helix domain-containing protein [Delftia acidovorans]|uniref:helix-turn-helix domain-containing protein n=1 Tax=Delftia acidovorans TaxID=80866 RepID=UPI003A5BB822